MKKIQNKNLMMIYLRKSWKTRMRISKQIPYHLLYNAKYKYYQSNKNKTIIEKR